MPDQSKFEKTIKLAKRYVELGMSKKRALEHAKQELKNRKYT
jgi:hypothetical protein